MAITQITDHTAAALARLPQQFKDKPKLAAFISALVDPIQDLENAMWQLLTERAISTAVGAQLNAIGLIVNQPRIGLSDDAYRRYLRARIAVNRSDGVDENLIRISRLILNDTDATLEIDNQGPAAVVVRIGSVSITSELAEILNSFLQDAKKSGVRLIVEYGAVDVGFLFTLDDGPGFGEYDTLDLAGITGIDTVLRTTVPGADTFRGIEIYPGSLLDAGEFTDATESSFQYKTGVTTLADFEAAIAASATHITVMTPGTPGYVLTHPSDTIGVEYLANGMDGGVLRDALD